MALYTDLSEVYDVLFPVSDAQRALFDRLLAAGRVRSVVDAGCGSGAQLLPFAAAGTEALGFDPDPALAARAREKLASFPRARVEVAGFADMSRLVSAPADLVLCLGSSLVHVPQDDAARFLGDARAVLSEGGEILLQILNYERMMLRRVTELPVLRAAGTGGAIVFRRTYEWQEVRNVRFRTELEFAGEGGRRVLENDIPLYPIYPYELWEMLSGAGFSDIRFFGDFARSVFAPTSEALVCLARKSA
jgi:glycine/sarcosine N-methyltransferase